jgi:hypothetical protein
MSITIGQVEKLFKKLDIKYCRREMAISYSVIADCMVGVIQRDKELFFKIATPKITVILYKFTSIEHDEENLYFCMNDAKLTVKIPK